MAIVGCGWGYGPVVLHPSSAVVSLDKQCVDKKGVALRCRFASKCSEKATQGHWQNVLCHAKECLYTSKHGSTASDV